MCVCVSDCWQKQKCVKHTTRPQNKGMWTTVSLTGIICLVCWVLSWTAEYVSIWNQICTHIIQTKLTEARFTSRVKRIASNYCSCNHVHFVFSIFYNMSFCLQFPLLCAHLSDSIPLWVYSASSHLRSQNYLFTVPTKNFCLSRFLSQGCVPNG